jgi:predicted metal-dependent TIM-barrel fold hydrolase
VTTTRVPSREIEISQSYTSNYGILLAQYNAMAKRLVEKNNEINLINFKQSTLINDLIYYLNEQRLDKFGEIESAKCSETNEKQQEAEEEQQANIPEVAKIPEEVEEKPHTKIPLRIIDDFPFKTSELITDDTNFHCSKEIIDHSSLLQLNLDEESTFDSTFHSN